jgi:hypothetical protein
MYQQHFVSSYNHWDLDTPLKLLLVDANIKSHIAYSVLKTDILKNINNLNEFLFFNFGYKDSKYSDWLTIWKRKYRQLTKIIRLLKASRKQSWRTAHEVVVEDILLYDALLNNKLKQLKNLASNFNAARRNTKAMYKIRMH